MSESKSVQTSPRRKRYFQPAIAKLTLKDAKAILETRAIPGDEQAKKLLEAINQRLGSK
jgi:hypothetical protein